MNQKTIFELTCKRGVIPNIPLTLLNYKFLAKLQEEMFELFEQFNNNHYIDKEELADCFIVICNIAERNNIDIEMEALTKVTKDVTRQKE